MKDEVEAGLAALLESQDMRTESGGSEPGPGLADACSVGNGFGATARSFDLGQSFRRVVSFSEWARAGQRRPAAKEARPSKEAFALRVDVDALVHLVAASLARERPRRGWWARATQLDYAREGRGWVRDMFYRSYQRVENVIDDWRPPGPGLQLPVDDAADVVVDMLLLESSPLLQGGAPLHPHMDAQRAAMERGFDQVVRNMRALQQRVDGACATADGIRDLLRSR